MTSSTAAGETYRPLRGTEDYDVVTGEAVLLDIPAASLPQRMASGLIDVFIAYVGLILTFIAFVAVGSGVSAIVAATVSLLIVIFWFVALPITVETLTRGRTLGKLILKLRAVRDDGGPIVFRHAFTRGLVGCMETYMFYGLPALFAAMATQRCRRLGDLAAGTYVVREITSINLPAPPLMPQSLARWAQSADMASLPDGAALAIRQLLSRQQTLLPASHAALSQALLAQVLPLVSPPPPTGTPADMVLAAILAERRRRDAIRLADEQQIRTRLLPPERI